MKKRALDSKLSEIRRDVGGAIHHAGKAVQSLAVFFSTDTDAGDPRAIAIGSECLWSAVAELEDALETARDAAYEAQKITERKQAG